MVDQFKEAFKEEAYELLNQLEQDLLEAEENQESPEAVSAVFRTMHTIKGSAGMFGYERISKFTHEVETVLDMVREGKVDISQDLIDLTLRSRDHINEMLEEQTVTGEADDPVSREIITGLKQLVEEAERARKPEEQETAPSKAGRETGEAGDLDHEVTYRISFKPPAELFQSGTNPVPLLRELREMGDYTCIANTESIPPLDEIVPDQCYTNWDILLTTTKNRKSIEDVFIFVADESEIKIDIIDETTGIEDDPSYKRIGEILQDRGIIDQSKLRLILEKRKRLGEVLLEENIISDQQLQSALSEQEHVKKVRSQKQTETAGSSIRVNAEKLDQLVDLVGEMVTVQARLARTSNSLKDSQLENISEQIERLTSELRNNTMSMRMVPIGMTFSKFRRLVRDLSQDLGKEIELETSGGETELDKTVIDRLNDPMVHIIRNSIDHGIETPEVREQAGKSRDGLIRLEASHSGASVHITISDNGKGLNADKLRERAVERGVIAQDAELSEQEIYQLIFAPGFSTAEVVSKVSGRGVGMDVVRQEIEALGGAVILESEVGQGTSVLLKIPLTLAIIDGLLVQVGINYYVFPLSVVERVVEFPEEEKSRGDNRRIIPYQDGLVPYVSLREFFSIQDEKADYEQVVVIQNNDNLIGFLVDQVIGDFQTVIKPLGKMYRDQEGISGATFLGDGSIALILDIPKLAAQIKNGF
ncbi:MAG: chemotaxis protein CheA [Spirochaetales bacterium]|nr:chemotaxis protein CheA [Spirochaetales bacterium]MCF7938005.1 chemotaxis protein CheA [Spirochaetales bacterium]